MDLKIGQTIYIFDENHRIYKDSSSAPIYREHFRPYTIISETTNEFICNSRKINKRSGLFKHTPKFKPVKIYTELKMNDNVWEQDNRYKIIDIIKRTDIATLKTIAKLINYQEGNNGKT